MDEIEEFLEERFRAERHHHGRDATLAVCWGEKWGCPNAGFNIGSCWACHQIDARDGLTIAEHAHVLKAGNA